MKYLKFAFFIPMIFLTIVNIANAQSQKLVANPPKQQTISNNEVENFLNILQAAIIKDDPNELAKFISYPCRWNRATGAIMINNQGDFIKSYKLIINKTIKDSISSSKASRLVATNQGFASSGGRVWFDPKKGIFVVNTLD